MRRGLSGDWTTADPTLAAGEWGLETNTDKFKIGDGSTAWTSLDYSSVGIGTAGGTFAGTVNFGADGTGQDVNFYSGTGGDHMKWDASEEQLVITGTAGTVALSVADGNALFADDVTITGSLTVNGATTTISTTNTLVEDSLIELNTGASSNANDLGIVMERGSTGNNAIIAWDESADKFTMGTTTATGASTGNLSITAGTLVADLEGDVTGALTGNADTASVLTPGRNINGTAFTGAADITVTAAAGTLTGATRASGVTASSLSSVGTLTSLTVSGGLVAPIMRNTPTASYTLVAADAGKLIEMNVGSTNTLTVPTHSGDGNSVAFATGTQIVVVQLGAGVTTLAGASGVGLNSKDDNKVIDGQYAAVTLIKKGTNDWWLFGALTS